MKKVELHLHIEGAARPQLVRQMARKNKIDVSDILTAENKYIWQGFTNFLHAYDKVASVFQTADDYKTLAYDIFCNLAKQNCIYGEIFVSPDLQPQIKPTDFINAIGAGMLAAKNKTAIEGRMILTAVRHLGIERAKQLATFANEFSHPLLTGFGMGGDERMFELRDFAPAYKLATKAGLGLTVHAGEFTGADSVVQAIEHLKVSRIGHGVRAIESEKAINLLCEKNIVLEVCPSSNIMLEVYKNFKSHPLPQLLAKGVRTTINSDDPPFFNTNLAQEYALAKKHFAFDNSMLYKCTRTALECAFIDEATKQSLLKKIKERT